MKSINRNNFGTFIKSYAEPFLTFLALFSITVVLYVEITERGEMSRRRLFQTRTERAEYAIINRFDNYIQLLKGTKGLFIASDTVSKMAWKKYINSINFEKSFQGIQGIGFAPYIEQKSLPDYLNKFRISEKIDLKIYPAGERSVYTPILFLDPENNPNHVAIGFDMFSDPSRQKAMRMAMETNEPAITGKVKLVQEISEDVQAGFLVYLPIYRQKEEPVKLEERMKSICGFVYLPCRMGDLMTATLGTRFDDIDIEIYDGSVASEETLMYNKYAGTEYLEFDKDQSLYKLTSLQIGGHTWKVFFAAMPEFGSPTEKNQPFVILGGGTVISLLVFFFMWAFANQRRSTELRKTITDNATAGLFLMDVKGKCTFMNPAAEEMTGYTLDEIKDKILHEVIHYKHPDGSPYPINDCPIDRALPQNRNMRAHEDVFIRKDGTFFHVLCATRPIYENGLPVSIVIEVRDITEEKKAQSALEEAKINLALSEAHYRSIAEGMPVLVCTTTTEGIIEYCNQKWYDYTGITAKDFSSENIRKIIIHPDEEEEDRKLWINTLKQGSEYRNQHRLKRYDGTYLWHLSRALPLRDDKGVIRKWFITSTDIHEQKLQNEELSKINRDLDNFIYTASHDLKAPISNLEGLMNLLYETAHQKIEKSEIKIFDMVNISINKFKETINDLTEITKIQKQTSEDIEEINFEEKLETVKVQIQNMIRNSEAKIHTHFIIPSVKFSSKNLQSIMYNLISNAIKYKAPGIPPEIHISTLIEDGCTVLSVKDNGLGIDPNKKDKLFIMFKRLHDHVEGTGIGLYIVKRIIENTGGKIEVESEIGNGSEFKIYFNA
ncbi:hypothetical protein BH23BAC1_BH23BAC1_35390 [soil metagenome]